jgi:hypothetical protein
MAVRRIERRFRPLLEALGILPGRQTEVFFDNVMSPTLGLVEGRHLGGPPLAARVVQGYLQAPGVGAEFAHIWIDPAPATPDARPRVQYILPLAINTTESADHLWMIPGGAVAAYDQDAATATITPPTWQGPVASSSLKRGSSPTSPVSNPGFIVIVAGDPGVVYLHRFVPWLLTATASPRMVHFLYGAAGAQLRASVMWLEVLAEEE